MSLTEARVFVASDEHYGDTEVIGAMPRPFVFVGRGGLPVINWYDNGFLDTGADRTHTSLRSHGAAHRPRPGTGVGADGEGAINAEDRPLVVWCPRPHR